jgi:anti-anti-sigma regulatory factor
MPEICEKTDLHESSSSSRPPVTKPTTPQQCEYGTLQSESLFQVRVTSDDAGQFTVVLFGELDLVSMAAFEQVVAEVLSGKPKELFFDLTQTQFISIQGYVAMGRCSLGVHVSIRSRTELAARVLAICGYDRVTIVIAPEPDIEELF